MQEGITNAVRHAEAKYISVIIKRKPDTVEVLIQDDGCGFDVASYLPQGAHQHGFGLANMVKRIKLLAGRLSVQSAPGKGTTLDITIPIPQDS